MTLMAAFQVLLSRYSGQARLRGRHADRRPHAFRGREPCRALREHARASCRPFRESRLPDPVARVRETRLGAYTHQDLPFEQIVAVLQPQRDPARSPLFQVLFAMQNAPLPAIESPDLSMTPLEPDTGTAKFDLALFAMEQPHGLELEIQYSTDLFDAATIDQMLTHFRTLLEAPSLARINRSAHCRCSPKPSDKTCWGMGLLPTRISTA